MPWPRYKKKNRGYSFGCQSREDRNSPPGLEYPTPTLRTEETMTTNNMERSKIVEASDTIEAIEECYRMGWSDGLPVVPPVDYKVREMLEMAGLTGE